MTRSLVEFATKTLSSLYFDSVKDTMYAGTVEAQQPVLAVMNEVQRTMTCLFAPILPHLAEEVHWYRQGAVKDPTPDESASMPSVFQDGWHQVPVQWHDPALEADMRAILQIRSEVFALATQCKQSGYIKSPNEADLALWVDGPLSGVLEAHVAELGDLFQVAHVHLCQDGVGAEPETWHRSADVRGLPVRVRLQPSPYAKCPRCWKFHSRAPDTLCERCAAVV